MRPPRQADLDDLLSALASAGVEFIVVGGAAAVMLGAPIVTQDLDVVHRRSEDNARRLLAVLGDLDAVVREPAERALRPRLADLLAGGHLRLWTRLGPLDILGTLGDGRGYDELLPRTEWVTDGALQVRVVDLPTLIDIKAATGRDKDKLAVSVLLALLKERGR